MSFRAINIYCLLLLLYYTASTSSSLFLLRSFLLTIWYFFFFFFYCMNQTQVPLYMPKRDKRVRFFAYHTHKIVRCIFVVIRFFDACKSWRSSYTHVEKGIILVWDFFSLSLSLSLCYFKGAKLYIPGLN